MVLYVEGIHCLDMSRDGEEKCLVRCTPWSAILFFQDQQQIVPHLMSMNNALKLFWPSHCSSPQFHRRSGYVIGWLTKPATACVAAIIPDIEASVTYPPLMDASFPPCQEY